MYGDASSAAHTMGGFTFAQVHAYGLIQDTDRHLIR